MRWNGFRQAEHQEGSPYGTNSLITDVLMDFLMRRNRSRRLLDNYITANRIGHSRHVPGAVYMFSADVSILSVSHLHSFQQLLQGAPWAIAARSICSSSALHRPSQRNASAGGGHPACPGTTLPMAEQSCPPCPKECYRAVFHTFIIWQVACPRGFLMPLLALCEVLCLIIRRGKGHSVSIFLPRLKEKS